MNSMAQYGKEVVYMRLPNSYGSVTKLSGRRRRPWMVRITEGWNDKGKEIRRVLGYYKTRAEALAGLAEYRQHPYDIESHSITFAELYQRWAKQNFLDHDESVPNAYTAAYKRLPNLHDMQFADIRGRHIQGEIDACPLGYSTKKAMKTLCNKLYALAIDCELVTTNYTSTVKLPPKVESRIHKPFPESELSILWQHTDDFSACVALVLCYTGFRPTELAKVRTENVHLAERYIMGGMKTAAGRNRCVPIAKKILPIVSSWYSEANEYLLMSPKDGKPVLTYDRMRSVWETSPALKLLPQQHLPHDGRHTCATMLDNAGVNLKTAQLILGHASHDVTRRVYTHKTIQQLIDAIDSI